MHVLCVDCDFSVWSACMQTGQNTANKATFLSTSVTTGIFPGNTSTTAGPLSCNKTLPAGLRKTDLEIEKLFVPLRADLVN